MAEGKMLDSPNDIVVHRNGNIYFTNPPNDLGGRPVGYGPALMRIDPMGQLSVIAKGKVNGIAISPDERRLYVVFQGVWDLDEQGVPLKPGAGFPDGRDHAGRRRQRRAHRGDEPPRPPVLITALCAAEMGIDQTAVYILANRSLAGINRTANTRIQRWASYRSPGPDRYRKPLHRSYRRGNRRDDRNPLGGPSRSWVHTTQHEARPRSSVPPCHPCRSRRLPLCPRSPRWPCDLVEVASRPRRRPGRTTGPPRRAPLRARKRRGLASSSEPLKYRQMWRSGPDRETSVCQGSTHELRHQRMRTGNTHRGGPRGALCDTGHGRRPNRTVRSLEVRRRQRPC